ncbi:MAG: hypothetical protein Q9218_002941 [Villophora microphyllina]
MTEATLTRRPIIPLLYRLFFLYIEPAASLVGAYYAFCNPNEYLRLTDPSTVPLKSIPSSTSIILLQLSNLYLLFTINEALVLRATSDIDVWRTLLFWLQVYWNVLTWNAIDWGNVGFVYLGATTRICFLVGLGIQGSPLKRRSKRRMKQF